MTQLLTIIITLLIVGIILWIIDSIPMNVLIKKIIYAVIAIAAIVWLAQKYLHIFL